MSDIAPPEINDLQLNSKSDNSREIAGESCASSDKNKSANQAESLKTKDKENQNMQKDIPGNDHGTPNPDLSVNDFSSRHGNQNSLFDPSDKRGFVTENKLPALKEEKSTKKKKIQKENANSNVKEDCEKKKRKKKKKKKGANCDDESAKLGKNGETSLTKENLDNKKRNKIEISSNEVQASNTLELLEKRVKENGDKKASGKSTEEEMITNKGDSKKSVSNKNTAKVDSIEETNDEAKAQEIMKNGENMITYDEIKSSKTAATEKNTEKSEKAVKSDDFASSEKLNNRGTKKKKHSAEKTSGKSNKSASSEKTNLSNPTSSLKNTATPEEIAELNNTDTLGQIAESDKTVISCHIADIDNTVISGHIADLNKTIKSVQTYNKSPSVKNVAPIETAKTEEAGEIPISFITVATEETPISLRVDEQDQSSVTRSTDIQDYKADTFIVDNSHSPLEFENTKNTPSKQIEITDHVASVEIDETVKVNCLMLIREPKKVSSVIIGDKTADIIEVKVSEADFVENEKESSFKYKDIYESGIDLDTMDGSAEVDNSYMDNGGAKDDIPDSTTVMTQEQLQQRLQEHHDAMTRLRKHAHAQHVKANIFMTSLRAKLRAKDVELKLTKSEHERQISAVLSHLLYLEGQMQKEHNDILEVLNEKDDIIRRQKAAIEDLVAKNNRYLQALKESHGYSTDNGMVKPQNHIMQQNGNISIQDHGNKVILRSNKTRSADKLQTSVHKVRFFMKDRLRRHKSSLELYKHEPLETLMEATVKYGSEENLVLGRTGKSGVGDRKERCRSLIDYPVTLFDVEETHAESSDSCFSDDFHTPTICRNDSTSSLVILSDSTPRGMSAAYGFNELSKSRSVPHGLPTVAENDVSPTILKDRPHSLPSVEMLAKDTASRTAGMASSSKVGSSPGVTTSGTSPPSESNAFKTFKNVFKRKGSKKKRAAAVTSGKEQTDALKQHFQKYDMT